MKSIFRIIAPLGAALAAGTLFVTGASADNDNENTNTSEQTAEVTQSSFAVGGDATAYGDGDAFGGSALSVVKSETYQYSEQLAANQSDVSFGYSLSEPNMLSTSVNGGDNDNENTNTSEQTAEVEQEGGAIGGSATSEGDGDAWGGWSKSIVKSRVDQYSSQIGANQSHIFFGFGP